MLPTTDLISAPDLLLCELLLHDPVGLMPISKQSPEGGPLELDGRKGEFDRRVRRLTALLLVTIRDDERDALRELRALLKRDWPNLGRFDRERILERAAEIIERIPRGDPIALRNRVEAAAIVLARRARRAAVRAFDLNAPAEQPSDSVVRGMELAMPASRFIQDEYARRGAAFRVAGLAIIVASLLAGDSAEDIERKLLARAGKAIDRPDYLKGVATAVLTQARTSALLDVYAEAGVDTFQVLEVLDERTCDKCGFMHGTEFTVASGRDLLGRVAAERLPSRIAEVNPFLREGVNADGDRIIFLVRGGRRTQLAVITQSRVGTVNRLGRFDPPADPSQLTRLGVGPPPYHPDCRGVVVPS